MRVICYYTEITREMTKSVQERFENVSKSKTFKNILDKFDLRNKRVLDIGCSNGEFLSRFGGGSVGLTVSREEMEEGRSRGLDLRVINIETEYLDEGVFDYIFANNIFEHMQSPHNFLIKIKKHLKPGGRLIFGVPCVPYFTPLVHSRKFRGSLASLHINFFTRFTLVKTVQYAGWNIIEVRGFHFGNSLLDHLLDPIYPHFYAVAEPKTDFKYAEKRLRELEGYNK